MQKELDFYQELRKKINNWLNKKGARKSKYAGYIMLAPDLFHLLVKLSLDKNVPKKEKAKLAIAIAYFISPIDLIPEALIGPLGLLDDISLAAYVLNSIINKTNPEIIKKHWAGDKDLLELIKEILKNADDMLGSGLWKKIKNLIK